jgi:hypothetical protein
MTTIAELLAEYRAPVAEFEATPEANDVRYWAAGWALMTARPTDPPIWPRSSAG